MTYVGLWLHVDNTALEMKVCIVRYKFTRFDWVLTLTEALYGYTYLVNTYRCI